jgi:chaperonin GroEL
MSANAKELIFEEEARQKLFLGMKKLADVVACTLGPKGRNVGLEKSWGAPTITNDGSSIVRDFELKDTFENMGVSIVKEVVQKIKEKSGDGTTTGTLLLKTLVEIGLKYVSAGASPIGLKRGMEKAVEAVIKELERVAIPVKGQQEIVDVASVSASSNREVGEMIAKAIEKVGRTGVITVEEAKGTETAIEIVEGMQFDRGYMSSYFCTNADKMTVEMKNAALLLVDRKISSAHDVLPILQSIASTGKDLVIIAEDLEGEVLSTLVVNRLRGTLRVAAVKAPGFGDNRKAMLQDIAVLTGATVISDDTGMNLREADASVLGQCDKVIITKDHTTVVSSNGDKEAIKARTKQIDGEIKKSTGDYEKKKLEERKAKLSGGVAQIHVGAATEPEMKNKKQAFEDSLNSTKAALESGIVPGGGVALLVASEAARKLSLEGDELLGAKIVAQACETPIRQIIANAGRDSSVVVAEVLRRGVPFGFNALTEQVEDLVAAGVIDPVKVVKNALLYASSAAAITLISEALIADAKEEEEETK